MPPAAHLFVADLEAPEVDGADRHHVERVLRLRPGEEVSVSDGRGGLRRCLLRAGLGLEPVDDVVREPAPYPPITVGFAVVKGDRPEWAVQKLTECGVDRIVPLHCDRSVVRWDAGRAARQVERLRRIAREAAMQSRRSWLAVVDPVTAAADLVEAEPASLALAHPTGAPPALDRPSVLVGPEGGWSDDELGWGLDLVAVGPTVLRTETAAVVSGALLCALRAGVVRSRRDPE